MSVDIMIKKVRDLLPGDIFIYNSRTLVATDEWSDGCIWTTLPKHYSYVGIYDYATTSIDEIDGDAVVEVTGNMEEQNMVYAKFMHPSAGCRGDIGYAKSQGLVVGNRYEVDGIAIGLYFTEVWLKGFQYYFNSVQFEFEDENGSQSISLLILAAHMNIGGMTHGISRSFNNNFCCAKTGWRY